MYKISKWTYAQAKRIGVKVKPSKNKNKKIDVFNPKGEKVASVGALGMNDYPTYLSKERKGLYPKGYADKRRKLYKHRHESDRHKRGSAGYFADQLLW